LSLFLFDDIMKWVIKMTINEIMKKKGMSRYRLAIISGIPWTTLSNICYGKKSLTQCDAKTIQKLSNALEMTTEEVLNLMKIRIMGNRRILPTWKPIFLPISKNQSMTMYRAKRTR